MLRVKTHATYLDMTVIVACAQIWWLGYFLLRSRSSSCLDSDLTVQICYCNWSNGCCSFLLCYYCIFLPMKDFPIISKGLALDSSPARPSARPCLALWKNATPPELCQLQHFGLSVGTHLHYSHSLRLGLSSPSTLLVGIYVYFRYLSWALNLPKFLRLSSLFSLKYLLFPPDTQTLSSRTWNLKLFLSGALLAELPSLEFSVTPLYLLCIAFPQSVQ